MNGQKPDAVNLAFMDLHGEKHQARDAVEAMLVAQMVSSTMIADAIAHHLASAEDSRS